MKKIVINPQRIEYMMALFGLDRDALLQSISEGLQNPIKDKEIFSNEIKESHLKKIDKTFKKGLSFYTDPNPIDKNRKSSILFRKKNFNINLNLGDRKIVNEMESRIYSLSALCKLSNYSTRRKLPKYKVSDKPQSVAYQIREKIHLDENHKKERDFLKKLIHNFALQNILVFEFVETWNKKDKANIDGFFIAPNTIVIKRNQKNFKREIFTLSHELGHYLLEEEELDKIRFPKERDRTEKWCDEFAFHFLIGREVSKKIDKLSKDSVKHDSREILHISRNNHISRMALFTHLATNRKITWEKYFLLKEELDKEYKQKEEIKNQEREISKENDNSPRRPAKPITSPLEESIYTSAFYEGVVEEYDLLSHFNKKTIEEIIYG